MLALPATHHLSVMCEVQPTAFLHISWRHINTREEQHQFRRQPLP